MVTSIGHSVPEVVEAIREQVGRLTFAHRGQFTNEPAEDLASLVASIAPAGFERVFFVSGGSEATESAIKLARRFHLERGERSRTRVIARRQSYHGNTLGALALSGHSGRRADYLPMLAPASHIAPIYCYRCPFGLEPSSCRIACADDLERAILEQGPENVAAFIAEPVVMTLAGVGAVPGYFQRIREICDRYGVLLIADEVITGFWRTGPAFACEAWGALPDLITCAKGMASGYAPLAAVLVNDRVTETIRSGSGQFLHGFTYGANPLACAAGLAVLRYMLGSRLPERVRPLGNELLAALTDVTVRHGIAEARGAGLLAGLELVSDRTTREPFPASAEVAKRLAASTFKAGVVTYPVAGTLEGGLGDFLMVAPPFTIQHEHIDAIAAALDGALVSIV
jgi:adenosylmethionine-8-amino-7-oxononanoate aminotransferase